MTEKHDAPSEEQQLDPHAAQANVIFEGIGKLYEARYGRLRPGKDDRLRDSISDDNCRQFSQWLKYEALDDAVMHIEALRSTLERYMFAYPAFRMKPEGAPGSLIRIEQERLMALEETAQRVLSGGKP